MTHEGRDSVAADKCHAMLRQAFLYGIVGGVQLLVDWAGFVALTMLGVWVVPANLLARVSGALMGYWLNGRYTFARGGKPSLCGASAVRFVAFWLLTTALSTAGVYLLDAEQGRLAAWLGKPLLDASLAVAGFLASRYWIYR